MNIHPQDSALSFHFSLIPGLFSQSESLDQGTISLDIYFLKVCKKSPSLTYHLKKSSS